MDYPSAEMWPEGKRRPGRLKWFCMTNEWAANLAAFVGVAWFLATVWVAIDYQLPIKNWLSQNHLLHWGIFGLICAANVFLMTSFVRLGFADCSKDETCAEAYRGRHGKALFPGMLNWVDHLGEKKEKSSRRPV
jgi:hypothetical protein